MKDESAIRWYDRDRLYMDIRLDGGSDPALL